MRWVPYRGLGMVRPGLLALLWLGLSAGSASAQIVFDGNILFGNNASGTLAGQFTGAPTATAGCPAGFNAAQLGTVEFTNNVYADPLLPFAVYTPNVRPNFQPALGSPAYGHALTVPNDGFFQQVCYTGAIGPDPEDDWTQGWTYYDSTGAERQDLHLPGMPDPRPVAIYDHTDLRTHLTWAADSNYLVRGAFHVRDQASLTIPAGVVVFEEAATLGVIVVERGGKIFAVGTANAPIIITSDAPPGEMVRGAGGGIYVLGRAKTSLVNSCAGDSAAAEGGSIGFYGGSDDDDGSGSLQYVRVEYAGKEITPNNELNSFTFCSVGRSTVIDHLEAYYSVDDHFEFFGGTADCRHLIGIDGCDDGFDWQMGYRGRAQFVICRQAPIFSPAGDQNGDKGIEADNNEFDFTQVQCAGRSSPIVSNFTLVGDHRVGPSFPGPTSAVNLRNGTAGTVINSIGYGFKLAGLKVDVDETWRAHCAAMPVAPAVYCPGALDVPLATGAVFVSRATPNPFRDRVAITFALPHPDRVTVEIYSADGRLVRKLGDDVMSAGTHSIAWDLGRTIPSGMYFYKVRAGGMESAGRVVRVQ